MSSDVRCETWSLVRGMGLLQSRKNDRGTLVVTLWMRVECWRELCIQAVCSQASYLASLCFSLAPRDVGMIQ